MPENYTIVRGIKKEVAEHGSHAQSPGPTRHSRSTAAAWQVVRRAPHGLAEHSTADANRKCKTNGAANVAFKYAVGFGLRVTPR